jgi:FHS family glucose/mannose:H+ symporter-like MFS transporter
MVSGALTCLAGLNCGWFGPMVPAIALAQKVPLVEAGSIISVYSAGSLIPLAIGRQLLERFGGRKCLLSAALLFSVGLALLGLGSGVFALSCGAALLGVGAGLNSIAGTICILRLASGSSAAAVGKLNVFFGIGALLGPVLAYLGLNSPFSYHAVYVFGAIFGLSVFLAAFAARRLDVSVPPAEASGHRFHPLQKPALLYTAAVFLYVGMEVALAAWLYTYLSMTCALPKGLASMSMTALWGGLTTGRMASIQLFKYFSAPKLALSFMAVVFSAILSLTLFPHMGTMALAVVFMLGLGAGPIFPTLISCASERYGEHSASVTSLVVTAGAFAGITFPIVIGQVFSRIGQTQGMFCLSSIACVLAAVFFTVQFKMKKPVGSEFVSANRPETTPELPLGSKPEQVL